MKVLLNISHFFKSKKVRKYISITSICILGLLVLSFALRNVILHHYLASVTQKLKTNHKVELHVEESYFHGINGLSFENIYLKPIEGDTLLKIEKLDFHFNLFKILFAELSLNDLRLENTIFSPVKADTVNNYAFIFRSKPKEANSINSYLKVNYAKQMDRLLEVIFNLLPSKVAIRNFQTLLKYDAHIISFSIDKFDLEKEDFLLPISIKEDKTESNWLVEGKLKASKRKLQFSMYSKDNGLLSTPFVDFKWNAKLQFNRINFSLDESEMKGGILRLQGDASVKQLHLQHNRISPDYVIFDNAGLKYNINIGSDFIEIDSTTEIGLNAFNFNPYFKIKTEPAKQITLSIHKPSFPSNELFSSLPKGLFSNLEGIETKGQLSYNLDFSVDLSIPDSLKFFSELKPEGFRIQHFGKTNLGYINEPFEHTIYEDGKVLRSFIVGPENPNYRTFAQIPDHLKYALLTSEDGAFFYHQGFVPDAFKESIIINLKQGRFVRGGSTISMQLVKNVFLNRNKTVARKLEEALIVWLIENQHLVSKERMYEVYLNIIEWGPGIYGANEAARFYFEKDVSKLTLAECIYLACIVPRPKGFKYYFDENHQLKESLSEYYRRVSEKMLKREQITESEFNALQPKVEVKGAAYQILLNKNAQTDSLSIIENEIL